MTYARSTQYCLRTLLAALCKGTASEAAEKRKEVVILSEAKDLFFIRVLKRKQVPPPGDKRRSFGMTSRVGFGYFSAAS